MTDEVHIASLVVRHRHEATDAIQRWVGSCPGLEIARQEAACSILLFEGACTRELMDCIDAGQASPGVISVNLIYHHAEPRQALEEHAAIHEGVFDDNAA